ncbi:hypothetical protein BUY37_12840, partial [Staphylococcus cohnii]|uniref:hypothetical protein n=1 Tax=Staphylococcus TaxID=1279 RepID=UPI000D418C70
MHNAHTSHSHLKTKFKNGGKVKPHFPFIPFFRIYFFVLIRSHAQSKIVLLTSLRDLARGKKLFICGLYGQS